MTDSRFSLSLSFLTLTNLLSLWPKVSSLSLSLFLYLVCADPIKLQFLVHSVYSKNSKRERKESEMVLVPMAYKMVKKCLCNVGTVLSSVQVT